MTSVLNSLFAWPPSFIWIGILAALGGIIIVLDSVFGWSESIPHSASKNEQTDADINRILIYGFRFAGWVIVGMLLWWGIDNIGDIGLDGIFFFFGSWMCKGAYAIGAYRFVGSHCGDAIEAGHYVLAFIGGIVIAREFLRKRNKRGDIG